MKNSKVQFNKAIIWILLSTFLVSGTAWMGWLYYHHVQHLRRQDPTYNIVAIVQTGPEKEVLKTVYLAELMGLSVDYPQNLYTFDTKNAVSKLLASPLIKGATIKRIRPGTVYIDYVVRQPVAYLADYTNTALDEEGYIFPFYPFFTPKKLPEIVVGLPPFGTPGKGKESAGGEWHRPLMGKEVPLAMQIIKAFNGNRLYESTVLKRVDVSKAYKASPGQREMVLMVEERMECHEGERSILCVFPRILRFNVASYQEQLDNYLILRSYLAIHPHPPLKFPEGSPVVTASPLVIDLRIPDLAFLTY